MRRGLIFAGFPHSFIAGMEHSEVDVLRGALSHLPGPGCFALDLDRRYVAFNAVHGHCVEGFIGRAPTLGSRFVDTVSRVEDPLLTLAGEEENRQAKRLGHQLERLRLALERALDLAFSGREAVAQLTPILGDVACPSLTFSPIRSTSQEVVGVLGTHSAPSFGRPSALRGHAEAQAREEVTRLADGLWNELNNLSVGLGGIVEALRSEVPAPTVGAELLNEVRDRANAARRLVRVIRSSAMEAPTTPLEVDAFLRELEPRLRAFAPGVEIGLDAGAPGAHIEADADELADALAELIRNAGEAGARRIVLRTRSSRADRHWPKPPAPYVLISVEDDGEGIPEARLVKIFEPYTGSRRSAQGIGLTRVRSVVHGHGGFVRVESRPSAGATVSLRLPTWVDDGSRPTEERPPAAPPPAHLDVFVVDDAPEVRRVLGRVLRHAGHRVLEAEDGIDALEKLDARGSLPDVVVLDLMMPRMDGVATYEALRARSADLPVLITSGYHPSTLGFLSTDRRARFLPKPFSPSEVLASLEDLLRG